MQTEDVDLQMEMTPHRMYYPLVGRWLTPDPGGRKVVHLANPQTWNMYTYAGDNPTTNNDPSGEYFEAAGRSEGFFVNALTAIARRPGEERSLIVWQARASQYFSAAGNMDTEQANITAISHPLGIQGQNRSRRIQVTVGNDTDLFHGAQMAPGEVSPARTTGHELEHAAAGLKAGSSSLQAGFNAMEAGDKPTPLTGSAQAAVDAIMNQKPDMTKAEAKALVNQLLNTGNQEWQKSPNRAALCQQTKLGDTAGCN